MRGTITLLILLSGCAHGDAPRKGHAASTMPCKRSKVELSETFEQTWQSDDGKMKLRYQVSASCHDTKKQANQAKLDYWRDCSWGKKDWDCGDWKSGTAPGTAGASTEWTDRGTRAR